MPAMPCVASIHSISLERNQNETYFFTWPRQDAHSWQGVQDALSPLQSESFAIFSRPSESYQEAKGKIDGVPPTRKRNPLFWLDSHWEAFSLSISPAKTCHNSRVWCFQGLNTNSTPISSIRLQILLFRLIPKRVFESQGGQVNSTCYKSLPN